MTENVCYDPEFDKWLKNHPLAPDGLLAPIEILKYKLLEFKMQKQVNKSKKEEYMEAVYNFKIGAKDTYSGSKEICVQAGSYKEAKKVAEQLLDGSKEKLGDLNRIVQLSALVSHSNIVERRMFIEERSADINISGTVTEVKVDGGTLNGKVAQRKKT